MKRIPKWLRRPLWITAFLLFAWYSLVGYKYQIIRIEGHSMNPSYHHSQWTLMLKKGQFSKNWTPSRFDVVGIYYSPTKEKLIKRVIGLPGNKIEIKDGYIYINDKILSDKFKNERIYSVLTDENGVDLRYWGDGPLGGKLVVRYVNQGPVVVPDDHIWVIGDNRSESFHGILPTRNIYGLFRL